MLHNRKLIKTGRFLAITLMAGWPVFASAQQQPTPPAPVEQGANTAQHFASYFNKAKSFYEAGRYPEAFALLNPLAMRGHADSVFLTGLMTYHGLGRPVDYTEAAEWFLKASDHGMARGRHFLGLMYRDGTGLEQNDTLALMWFRLAAREGVILSRNEADRLQKTMNALEVRQAKKLADTYLAGLGEVTLPENIDLNPPPVIVNADMPPSSTATPAETAKITLTEPEPAPDTEAAMPKPAPGTHPEAPAAPIEPVADPAPAAAAVQAPASAPSPVTVSPTVAAKNWAVQVGAFGNKKNAARLQANLVREGFAVQVSDIEINSRFIKRVRVVDISDRITADAIKAKIDRNYQLTSKVIRLQ